MSAPRIVVTGASGFVGRNLIEALGSELPVVALSRASPSARGMSLPAHVEWHFVDIAEPAHLREAVAEIRASGGAEILVHLAGHYDFTGEQHPDYRRVNVEGTRNVLEAARALGVRDFLFASSVAACAPPGRRGPLTEADPADGDTPYGESKRLGEALVREQRGAFRTWIVRFAALFSDWCEYEPLYRFLEIWLSRHPRHRMLAGHGLSAVPYLHVRDGIAAVRSLLALRESLDCGEPLLVSSDGATTHLELFEATTAAHFGERRRPLLIPGPVCRAGLWARELASRATGLYPFERPWMARFIDQQLAVDSRRTRARLGWAPRPRLGIVRRLPFLVQNRKAFPAEWQRRNHAVLRQARLHENLRLYRHLERHADEIAGQLAAFVVAPERAERFPGLRGLELERLRADGAALIRALIDAVRTGEKELFRRVCGDLARRRKAEGFPLEEVTAKLDTLNDLAVLALAGEQAGAGWSLALYDHVTMTVQLGVDEACEVFEERT